MKAHIALYDPSQPAADGSFWSWRSPALDRGLLDRLYYDVAIASRPEDPRQAAGGAVFGGIAQLTPEWVCAFRFGDGGRDSHGRLGRYVLLAAFVPSSQAGAVNLAQFLVSPAVHGILSRAPTACPVPAPESLEIELPAEMVRTDPVEIARVLREEHSEFAGPLALAEAGALCASLPADRPWICRFSPEADGIRAVLDCPTPKAASEPSPPPVPPTPPQPPPAPLPPRRPLPTGVLVGSLAALCLVTGLGILIWPRSPHGPTVTQPATTSQPSIAGQRLKPLPHTQPTTRP